MTLTVHTLHTSSEVKEFIRFPWSLYAQDPAWIPPLLQERKDFLNPKKNPFFEHAEVALFVAKKEGRVVGRISVQIDRLHNERHEEKTGFFGLFESIHDNIVSHALFDKACSWLRERGMNRIRGPFNLSINHESGLLIDGFKYPPMILMGHNPPYYQGLVEEYGFEKIKDLFCWAYDAQRPVPETTLAIANEVKKYPGLTLRQVDLKSLDRDVRIVLDIFNDSWSNNWGFVPMTENEIRKSVKEFKLILDPRITLIAEVDQKPAGIALALPNLNEAIRDLNGRLLPTGLFKLLYRLKTHKIHSARLILLGIKKEFRHDILKGLSVLLYAEMHQRGAAAGYTGGELSWTLEDNIKINTGIEMLGGKKYKTYRLYEKAL